MRKTQHTWQRLVCFHTPYRDNEGVETMTLAERVELSQHDGVIGRLTHYKPTHKHIKLNCMLCILQCLSAHREEWLFELQQPSFLISKAFPSTELPLTVCLGFFFQKNPKKQKTTIQCHCTSTKHSFKVLRHCN